MCAYTCVKRQSKFWISFSVGKWNKKTCKEFVQDIKRKIRKVYPSKRAEFFSDGNDDYKYVFSEVFGTDRVNYGQLIKRHNEGELVKEKKTIFGSFDKEKIETTVVENLNSVIRERVGRFVRRTRCFAKKKERLKAALTVFMFHWNFMKLLPGLKKTPAMVEGIQNRVWGWEDLLNYKLAFVK
jgi:IS1 family transposase